MINQAGKNVAATPATVAQSFLELGPNGVLEDDNGFDLTNPQSAFAWPVSVDRSGYSRHAQQAGWQHARGGSHCGFLACACAFCVFQSHLRLAVDRDQRRAQLLRPT
jgi:hypothetical protein